MRAQLLGIVTYNVWRENTRTNVRLDIEYLLDRPDVDIIVLQECANFYTLIRELARDHHAWTTSAPDDADRAAKQNMVLWRTRLAARGVRFVDMPESSTSRAPDRRITKVRLAIDDEHQVIVLATHMQPHVQRRSWWRLPRLQDFRLHMRAVATQVARAPKPRAVVAVADWNVDLRSKTASAVPFFPRRTLGRVEMRSNWDALGFVGKGTKGSRYIDAIFLRRTPWMHFKDQQIIQLSSDHRALLVRFSIST